MDGKTCIVTGANSGIGLETARGLARRGAHVILACRDGGRGEAALDDIRAGWPAASVELGLIDLASLESVRAFASRFRERHDRLDVLVNNAGLWTRKRALTDAGHELVLTVNHLAPFLLTNLLLEPLEAAAPSRIVVVSSALHGKGRLVLDDLHFERRRYSGMKAYNDSKLMNVMFVAELARRLAGTGVTANSLHPGVVATNIWRELPRFVSAILGLFLSSPEKGAATTLHVATSPELEGVTGCYFDDCKERHASRRSQDEALQRRLWEVSAELTGLAPAGR